VLTCREIDARLVEESLGPHGLVALGYVDDSRTLTVRLGGTAVLSLALEQLRARFEEGLHGL
jgi:hypothetical protein